MRVLRQETRATIAGMDLPFDSPYRHGFVRVAVCIPAVRLGAPAVNAERTIALARRAHDARATVALFPELGLSGYSNEDLFHQDALLDATTDALARVVDASGGLTPILIAGAPLRVEQKLFNCAVVVHRGQVLGITPKTYLPTYREFYERRQFTPGTHALAREVAIFGRTVPFGNVCGMGRRFPGARCTSRFAKTSGCLCRPAHTRRSAVRPCSRTFRRATSPSAKLTTGGCCAPPSPGDALPHISIRPPVQANRPPILRGTHGMIYENSHLLAETTRFATDEQMIVADIDVDRLVQERVRMTSFNDAAREERDRIATLRRVAVSFERPEGAVGLAREIERFPYVPGDPAARDERCFEAYNIQVQGLATRLSSAGIQRAVIGVSGGLDSTHALIVAARAMDRLGLPRTNVLAFSMPGFATSEHTRANAMRLMRALGVTAAELDIRPSCLQMLKDLKHPFAEGQRIYDVNSRTCRPASGRHTSRREPAWRLVVGTGTSAARAGCAPASASDVCNVNASVLKTLIRHLIRWVIRTQQFDEETGGVLHRSSTRRSHRS
jgi:NAD+ synthase (glutamine-hydrolysing)